MKRVISLLICLLLCGCSISQNNLEKEKHYLNYLQDEDGNMVLPLNTDCYLTTVSNDLADGMVKKAEDLLYTYHKLLDSHRYYKDKSGKRITNLKVINNSFNQELKIDKKLFVAIKEAIEIAKLTQGYFNPTIGKVTNTYDGKFTSFDTTNTDPDNLLLREALNSVVPYDLLEEYIILDDNNDSIKLIPYNDYEFELDLGAFSKGYVSEKMYEELIQFNSSFILNCGSSSIITYNEPSENINWTTGVKDPNSVSEMLYAITLNNSSLSTSGDYEQYYFLSNGTRRHHILNPFTGLSENYYREIILTTDKKAGLIDAFTTALFSIEDTYLAIEMINDIEKYYGINIDYCFVKDGFKLITNIENKEHFIDKYTSISIKEIEVID